jgi:ABC-type dipeptide/oligopeptide/nickel transport system permease component
MLLYIVRRLVLMVPVVFGILLMTFAIKAMIPTDAVAALFEGQVTESESAEAAAAIRHKYGLDRPWYEQFIAYSAKILSGDLGESIRTRRPVIQEIGFRYLNTLELTVAALAIAIVIGLGTGMLAAYFKDTWIDVALMAVGLAGISMPAFFFGIAVLLIFSVWLGWLPVIPRGGSALLLPALTLGLIESAPISRISRSNMLDVLGREYIRAARARGVPETTLLLRHALPNALLAIVTMVGLQFGGLLGGAFIIEIVFGWRGVGEIAVQAIQWRDFAITQGVIVIGSGVYLLVNLVVDLAYTVIDPRISLTGQ